MEDDAAGLVLRLALKTRFSEMGWGSTPPSSAKHARLAQGESASFTRKMSAVRNRDQVPNIARIAQLVEQRTENPCVGGSIPSPGTNVASRRNSCGLSKGSATKDFVVTQLALVV